MGVLWTTYPLNDEVKGWLLSENMDVPDIVSRLPTQTELMEVLNDLDDVSIDISHDSEQVWRVFIESTIDAETWTVLKMSGCEEGEHLKNLVFEKGDIRLIKTILTRISRKAGAQVLVPDTGDKPQVITGDE